MKIREAVIADAKAIQAIYAPYVEQTAVTFEYNVPSEEEFRKRIETVKQKYPWIVAEADGKIEHVHECAVVLRWRHLDLSHPHLLRPAALHHHHWHSLGKDALPAGKAGPVTIRNGSRITNMCYSISLLCRRRHIVKLS